MPIYVHICKKRLGWAISILKIWLQQNCSQRTKKNECEVDGYAICIYVIYAYGWVEGAPPPHINSCCLQRQCPPMVSRSFQNGKVGRRKPYKWLTQPNWANTHWTHGAFDSFMQKLDRIHYLRVLINPSHLYNLNFVFPQSNSKSLIRILIWRRFFGVFTNFCLAETFFQQWIGYWKMKDKTKLSSSSLQ